MVQYHKENSVSFKTSTLQTNIRYIARERPSTERKVIRSSVPNLVFVFQNSEPTSWRWYYILYAGYSTFFFFFCNKSSWFKPDATEICYVCCYQTRSCTVNHSTSDSSSVFALKTVRAPTIQLTVASSRTLPFKLQITTPLLLSFLQ